MLKNLLRKIIYKEKADSVSYVSWLRKKGVQIGDDVVIYAPMKTQIDTTCPWLLTIGDHVRITQGVTILTHDYSWSVLKCLPECKGVILGAQSPVVIGSNVFIGMNATITRGVSIGDNVIIGTGSVVTKDCESDSVYAGNPARKIMTVSEYREKREALQFEEAKIMAINYRKIFGRNPPKEVFSEYFMMFCSSEEAACIPAFKKQMALCHGYDDTLAYMRNQKPLFDSYEEFLSACYADD